MLADIKVEHEMNLLLARLDEYARDRVPADEQIKRIRQYIEWTHDAARKGWL